MINENLNSYQFEFTYEQLSCTKMQIIPNVRTSGKYISMFSVPVPVEMHVSGLRKESLIKQQMQSVHSSTDWEILIFFHFNLLEWLISRDSEFIFV